MSTSSVFHFFARLMKYKGHFSHPNPLSAFNFPRDMIAAESKSGFPDFVLKTNRDTQFPGGEFIELKDARTYQISSFNSTMPSATKPVSQLSNPIVSSLIAIGEDPDALPVRDVYYLVRGLLPKASPDTKPKTVLVSGAFFQTLPVDQVLTEAFGQVATDSARPNVNVDDLTKNIVVEQKNFAASRRVEGSGFSVRFRVMAQADPETNLLDEKRYPAIGPNTLTFLAHEPRLPSGTRSTKPCPWNQAPSSITRCDAYSSLERAFEEIDPDLKSITSLSILKHPLNGPFFMAQV